MHNSIYTKTRLARVAWKDLLALSRSEVVLELLITVPWLSASLLLAWSQLYAPAMFCSFVFFLCGLRQCHNGFHYALGLSKKTTEWFLFALSLLMMCSMHAVKYNHLQHHKHCLDEKDIEGSSARMRWWVALLYGPLFPIRLNIHAWKNGNADLRRWIFAENIFILLLIICALGTGNRLLCYHAGIMLLGECFTAFFAVWTVHHDCDLQTHFSRTIRGRFLPRVFYNMFYHTEHHLFPKVPTRKLPELAKRIEAVIPEISQNTVL
jgi:fatty acid desaturase